MTPKELYEQLNLLSPNVLIDFIVTNNTEMRITFLQATPSIENNKAFASIVSLLAKWQLQDDIISSAEVQSLYTHLAFYFKRANNIPFVDACTTQIVDSVFKKRLSAWLHYNRYDKFEYYITEFENYLEKLSSARIDDDVDYTYEILNDLQDYKTKIKTYLPDNVKKRALELFTDKTFESKYPVLIQYNKKEILSLKTIEVTEYTGKEYLPSLFSEKVFNDSFINHVKKHALFGYSFTDVIDKIIKKGQTNFDKGYEKLSASDVVKLYCYCNMRMHFFSSLSLYERSDIISKYYKDGRIKFIDLGCGPATSGLAFTEYLHDLTGGVAVFDYFGIDSSTTMQHQGKEMLENQLFSKENQINFYKKISDIDVANLNGASCIIINACYVFASESLDINEVLNFINNVKKQFPYIPKFLFFQNPTYEPLNKKYFSFKDSLSQYQLPYRKVDEISFHYQRNTLKQPKKMSVYYEVLKL